MTKWFDVVCKIVEPTAASAEVKWAITGLADEIDDQLVTIAREAGLICEKLNSVATTGNVSRLMYVGARHIEELHSIKAARDANIRCLRMMVRTMFGSELLAKLNVALEGAQ